MIIFTHSRFLHLKEELDSAFNNTTNYKISNLSIVHYNDGEIQPIFPHSIRYDHVVYIAAMDSSDSIMETFLTLDAAKRAGYDKLTLVVPYLGYSRQDRIKGMEDRTSIGSNMIARLLQELGIDNMITIDLHNPAIQASYNIPFTNLNGAKLFIPYLRNIFENGDDMVVVSPDHGASERSSAFARSFPKSELSIINKVRNKNNEIISMDLIGKVSNKHAVIVDDICDSGNTLFKAAKLLMDNGALSVRAICTHGLMTSKETNFVEKLNDSLLTELIVTNSYPHSNIKTDKLKIISISTLIVKTLTHLEQKTSLKQINTV